MRHLTLEQRVAALEKQVAGLQAQPANGIHEKPWLRTLGAFAGDEEMKEVFDEALKLREKDRKNSRRRRTKKVASQRVGK